MNNTLNLETLGDLSSLLDTPSSDAVGVPMELAMNLIDEDPNQPRQDDNPGFSAESLQELAETIMTRGVKTPISVRRNGERYVINHGARRFRASKLVGKATIPAFVDNDYSEVDQVIENLQRNELTAREIAVFIGRELARGKKKKQIAAELGKSASFVSQHVTLLDLPSPLADAFNAGRLRDVTVINEFASCFKIDPEKTTAWVADPTQELTRSNVKLLREFLATPTVTAQIAEIREFLTTIPARANAEAGAEPVVRRPTEPTAPVGEGDDGGTSSVAPTQELPDNTNTVNDDNSRPVTTQIIPPLEPSAPREAAAKEPDPLNADPAKLKRAIVSVKHDGRYGRLILTKRPPADGWAWVKYDDDGHEFEADLTKVKLIAVIEG